MTTTPDGPTGDDTSRGDGVPDARGSVDDATHDDRAARGKRTKRILLLATVAGSGLAMLAWSQTWFTIEGVPGTAIASATPVSGGTAAPPLMAIALAGLASVAGLALAGLMLRWVLGVLVVVLGGTGIATSALALGDPARSVAPVVTELTGVAGSASTTGLLAEHAITAGVWPWVGIVSGAWLVVAGIAVLATSMRWPTSARRFETRFVEADSGAPVSSVDQWDALTSGDDPTARADATDAAVTDASGDRDEHRESPGAGVDPRKPRID